MAAPEILEEIPAQITNEQAAYGPFDLKKFIQTKDSSPVRFSAQLTTGESLPKGMICTEDGILTGIPAKDTQGNYEIEITAENAEGFIEAIVLLTVQPSMVSGDVRYYDKIKNQVWDALEKKLPMPDLSLSELLERDISLLDLYYLLERWGVLTIWDAFNLDVPSEKKLLTLPGASAHYHVYDRGSCLVAAPIDLFDRKRTIEDGLRTARAAAREAFQRNWTVELVGLDKLCRAAWVEIQHLGDHYNRKVEVINYNPTPNDIQVYTKQAIQLMKTNKPEGDYD